ncbi:MAG: stage II sporulation protein M [Candidatus Nanoarchaeia archaeon]
MVLESFLTPRIAERHPLESTLMGFLYGSIGLFLALWVFEEYASLVMIFLTSMAAIPLLYRTIFYEESKHTQFTREAPLLKSHSRTLSFLLLLFLGAAISYSVWYVVLPAPATAELFSAQTETIVTLNQRVTGQATQLDILSRVFLNNVKVMIFCIIFSFIYGSGAIFILMWNASVIGAAVGNFFRVKLAALTGLLGMPSIAEYFHVISLSILRYALHGIPEILAYITAGLAGGIISISVIRHDFGTKDFERTILDASDLILIALLILGLAAGIEVYVTPTFF